MPLNLSAWAQIQMVSRDRNPCVSPQGSPTRLSAASCSMREPYYFWKSLSFAALSGNPEKSIFSLKLAIRQVRRLAAQRGSGSIMDDLLPVRLDLIGHALLGVISISRLSLASEMLDKSADPAFRDAIGARFLSNAVGNISQAPLQYFLVNPLSTLRRSRSRH